jgi:hypothetical protein
MVYAYEGFGDSIYTAIDNHKEKFSAGCREKQISWLLPTKESSIGSMDKQTFF